MTEAAPNICKFRSYRQEAARRGVSVDTIKRMAKRGEIKVVTLSPRRRGIPIEDENTKPAA
jgi:hypothetical protein